MGESRKAIGGYFEWEFPRLREFSLHKNAHFLNSARHALEFILLDLKDVKKVWIPYFTCEVVLQPLNRLGIAYEFYHINDSLKIDVDIRLDEGEYLVYTNYYGLMDSYVLDLVTQYGNRLIVDNAQALFAPANDLINQFYSPRKFVGMPDGGIAVTNFVCDTQNLPDSLSYDCCSHLLKRVELDASDAYRDFQENDGKIDEKSMCKMSELSKRVLLSVDLENVKKIRRENFNHLHSVLGKRNRLNIPSMDSFACPLVYPFFADKTLKKKLIQNKIFVATYWPNVFEWTKPEDVEYQIAENVVCLPIDQRYGIENMDFILQVIND